MSELAAVFDEILVVGRFLVSPRKPDSGGLNESEDRLERGLLVRGGDPEVDADQPTFKRSISLCKNINIFS